MEYEGALQLKIEKIIRSRCYETRFWKEECFGLNAESIIDKAVELDHIGGIYGNTTPTPFLCLLLKLLQVEPTEDIVLEYILDPEFKYLRALGAFYLRLTFPPRDIYRHLEPLLNDSRKLRVKESLTGTYTLSHVDQFVDDLLAQERVCDVILPRLPKRYILEENDELDPRVSAVQDEWEATLESRATTCDDDVAGGDEAMDVDDARDVDEEEDGRLPDDAEELVGTKVKVSKKKAAGLFKSSSSSKGRSGGVPKPVEEEDAADDQDNGGGGFRESMSVEETNKMRVAMGLKPLRG